MIRLFLGGGLGNQLFQYASARAICIRTGASLEIDLRYYPKSSLGTPKGPWLTGLPVKATFRRYDNAVLSPHHPVRRGFERMALEPFRRVIFDNQLAFNEEVLRAGDGSVLVGLFQQFRYFENEWRDIEPDLDMSRYADDIFLEQVRAQAKAWCAVHLRRGDYVGDPRFEMRNPTDYYIRAMGHVRSVHGDPHFVVFSDDAAWCRAQPWLDGCTVYEGAAGRHPAADLITMSRAPSIIIGNSSYSWWSAWLGDSDRKTVIAPSIWVDGLRTSELGIAPRHWLVR